MVLRIAFMLVKNYVVNPFIHRYRYMLLGLIVLLGLASISIFYAPTEKQEAIVYGVKTLLRDLGLSHNIIVDLLSSATILAIVYMVFRGGLFIVVAEEAEYELLLTQPISIRTYFAGKTLSIILQYLSYSVLYVTVIPIVLLFTHDIVKAIMTPLILSLILSIFPLSRLLVDILRIVVRSNARSHRIVDAIIISYVVVGLLHSAIAKNISPILSLPLKPVFEAIYHSFTTKPVVVMLQYVSLTILELFLIALTITLISSKLTPEHIKPLYLVARERLLWTMRPQTRIKFKHGSLRNNVYKIVVGLTHLSGMHILLYAITLTAAVITAEALKVIAYRYFTPLVLDMIAVFLTPFLLSIAASGLVNMMLGNDLAYLWVHRVYVIDSKPLAEALVIKYVLSLTEALLVVGVVNWILSNNFYLVLTPIIALPLTIITAPIVLFIVLRFASRRKVIKQAVVGLYVVEDLVLMLLWSIIVMFFLAVTVVYNYVVRFMTVYSAITLVIVSIASSIIVGLASTRLLSRYIARIDVVS